MILVTLDFALYRSHGIHDPAIVTIPLFVMLGPLLVSRRLLPHYLMAALASIIIIGSMELPGESTGALARNIGDIVVICLLAIGSGLLAWVTIGHLEDNVRRARKSESSLHEAYERTLEGWSKALEHRDLETHGHTRRVVNLCLLMAREWALTAEQMIQIRYGALLHDIGKLAIPDRILLKEGPLTGPEQRVMQRHPDIAMWMLSEIPYLLPALGIPASHHEHWDGTGYPKGLKGTEIPFEARLFAVVDSFDALCSNRPYRRAWPRTRAFAYIKENAGRLFDPEICAVFTRIYKANAFGEA